MVRGLPSLSQKSAASLLIFVFRIERLWKLDKDVTAAPAVGGILSHHGMAGGSGTGEEIQRQFSVVGRQVRAMSSRSETGFGNEHGGINREFLYFLGAILRVKFSMSSQMVLNFS